MMSGSKRRRSGETNVNEVGETQRKQKKMEKLPFVVFKSDLDDPSDVPQDRIRPSHLILGLKRARGRKKKKLEGDWNAVLASHTIQQASSFTTTIKSPGKKAVADRNSDLAPTIEKKHCGKLLLESEHLLTVRPQRLLELA